MSQVDFSQFAQLVNEDQLGYTEEAHEGINRARLIQGDASLAKDKELNKTVRYTGGIGLSAEGLPSEIVDKGKTVTLPNAGDYVVFPSLEVVVLASARTRRLYLEVDGQRKQVCGSNHVGQGAVGFNGDACAVCPYFPKNVDERGGDSEDKCKAHVSALIYIPEFDHAAIFSIGGNSYIEADEWLRQVSTLSKKFAELPEMKASGLKRVNSYFFKTTLSASEFFANPKDQSQKFNKLVYSAAATPYQWPQLLNSREVIARSAEILKDMQEPWGKLYVEAQTALLPSSTGVTLALPATASKVVLEAPALPAAAASAPAVEEVIVAPEMTLSVMEPEPDIVTGF